MKKYDMQRTNMFFRPYDTDLKEEKMVNILDVSNQFWNLNNFRLHKDKNYIDKV